MGADNSPLSGYWSRRPANDTRTSAEILEVAGQLEEELGYVAAGQLRADLVLCRYSKRQILGAMCHWGLDSDLSRRVKAYLWPLLFAPGERAD